MLLYAIYTPAEVNSWHRERYFAFASIESFVRVMGTYNWRGATLEPVEHDFLDERAISMATLIHWNPETKECEEAGTVFVSDNSMRDSWDGSRHEIHLVEHAADEKILKQVNYA